MSSNVSGEKAATMSRLDHLSIWASYYMRWRLSNWEQLKGSPVKLGIVFLLSNVSFSLSISSPMSVQSLHILQGVERLLPIQEAFPHFLSYAPVIFYASLLDITLSSLNDTEPGTYLIPMTNKCKHLENRSMSCSSLNYLRSYNTAYCNSK